MAGLNIMGLLSGAPLALPDFPCAWCAAETDPVLSDDPARATTVALGTPACFPHAREVLRLVVGALERVQPTTVADDE